MQPIAAGQVPGLRFVLQRRVRPDREVAFFESWHGQYSDNPRAISERLHERAEDLHQVWAVDAPCEDLPGYVEAVKPYSGAYLRRLGEARVIISSNSMPTYLRTGPGTTYLQTWHGTPLKRIGYDMLGRALDANRAYLSRFKRDVEKWDLLLSPNRFSTEIFRNAFRFRGPILETGYPRNDLLKSELAQQLRAQTRRDLYLPDDRLAVFYAPTLRDGTKFRMMLDTQTLDDRLSGDCTLLLRRHHLDVTAQVPRRAWLRDVTHFTDIRRLYLAADVLLTDYSSAMFDFAVTRKPILLYPYDLELYRDRLRGFYFDLEESAPGPILRSTNEVIDALADLHPAQTTSTEAYDRFVERFCHLDDGHAADRVVDAVLGERGVSRRAS